MVCEWFCVMRVRKLFENTTIQWVNVVIVAECTEKVCRQTPPARSSTVSRRTSEKHQLPTATSKKATWLPRTLLPQRNPLRPAPMQGVASSSPKLLCQTTIQTQHLTITDSFFYHWGDTLAIIPKLLMQAGDIHRNPRLPTYIYQTPVTKKQWTRFHCTSLTTKDYSPLWTRSNSHSHHKHPTHDYKIHNPTLQKQRLPNLKTLILC